MLRLLQLLTAALLVAVGSAQLQPNEENCLIENTAGCSMARPPQYMIMAPKRIRPNQVYQLFTTILRMEYGQEFVHVYVSIIQGETEHASSALRFDRPSSRIMQLRMPPNSPEGKYKLRVEGKLSAQDTGNIWFNETEIDFSTKQASLFLQMSKPIYKQGQIVHFRIVPILPNMMPKYGSMIVYVDDPTGIPVRRWQGLQTNAGGIVSQQFELSDQPNYGTWHVRVDAFGHTYRHPFIVEEFWMPRFDVNVSVPAYVMVHEAMKIDVAVLTNHTSGRPCMGNASITAFFVPSEEYWNQTEGWKKPYNDIMRNIGSNTIASPVEEPTYRPVSEVPVKDYYMYFAYEYRFIDFFKGRMDFQWSLSQLKQIAKRGGVNSDLKGHEFVFFVNVTDWYSDLNQTGWAGTTLFDSQVKLTWVGGRIRTFKPNSIMKVQVAISKYDGTPVTSGGAITINQFISDIGTTNPNTNIGGRQTRVPINGIAEFEFNLGPNTKTVQLKASYSDPTELSLGELNTLPFYATRYYSPTNSFISIMTSTDHPMVNEYMIFHVKTSNFVLRIYYQVISQSNIIIGDELEMTSKQKTFAIALSREMIPTARIIVYYIRQPEELVLDVLHFFVNGTSQNQVKLEINRGKDFSRDTIEFNAYADPGSYVAFSGMLLDLYSRGLSDGITENKLIDELMTYDSTSENTYRQLWRVSDTEFEYNFFIGSDYGIDANTSFLHAGLVILTDARVPRLFNDKKCREEGSEEGVGFPCFSGDETQCFTPSQQCDTNINCQADGADEFMCEEEKLEINRNAMHRVSRVMRFYDNSSWAWQEIFVKPNGRVDFRVDVPKYPLSWVINGISISRNLGLGIMQRPLRYDAARYMYIQVEHPSHIIRGEQIGVRVTVFNYWYEDDYIEVLITMHGGNDFEFITVGSMGIVTSYAPTTHMGDHQTIVFLEPGESQDIYLPIVSRKGLVNGELDFHISATCFMEKDEYHGKMYVKPDGIENYYHLPVLIDLIRYPSIVIPTLDIPVDEQFRKLEVRENLYVPESPTTYTSLFGDVVTPGFFEDYLNAENLLYRPYGGGEMITFNFAYNTLTLFFLKNSQQLTTEQLSRSLRGMNIAFQRILSYMNPDGSFRMFRDDPTPSLWLTAFVAKTVTKANFGEWERELFIPRTLINKIVLYMCSRQNETSGAFEPTADEFAYDRKMASLHNMKTHRMRTEPIPLTAYVLIALYQLKDASEDAASCRKAAIDRAVTYLSDRTDSITEIFHKAITTYALTLSSKPGSFDSLWNMRRNDSNRVYFSDSKVQENPSNWQQNILYLEPRQELMNDAYAVQSTAYALLATIQHDNKNNYVDEREYMMDWLNTMRNSFGGMASTQDTIMALEALFKFSEVDTHRNVFDLLTDVSSTASPSWRTVWQLKKSNNVRLLKSYLPQNKVYGYIQSKAHGTGRSMLQMTSTKNVEWPWLIKPPQSYGNGTVMKFFDIYRNEIYFSGRNDSIMEMKICCSWAFTERSLTSGLAVLEVDIPTGYVAMNNTLRDYVKSKIVPNLKRAESYNRKVVFYFDYLDASTTCVYFRADRWYPVANSTIQHKIRLYDYYEPGMHNTTMYTTLNLFLINICLACGSYQCPYCPYFNTATIAQAGVGWMFTVLVTTILQRILIRNGR